MTTSQIKDLTAGTIADTDAFPYDTAAGATLKVTIATLRKNLFASPAAGDLLSYNGTDWVRLAAVAAGTALVSTGTASAPAWNTALIGSTWTPTLTAVSNIPGTPTAYLGQYTRIGNIVTASCSFDVQPGTASSQVKIGIALPIASALTNAVQLNGNVAAAAGAAADSPGAVYGDATNDRAEAAWIAGATAIRTYRAVFQYLVI